jgi:hypothetical protein
MPSLQSVQPTQNMNQQYQQVINQQQSNVSLGAAVDIITDYLLAGKYIYISEQEEKRALSDKRNNLEAMQGNINRLNQIIHGKKEIIKRSLKTKDIRSTLNCININAAIGDILGLILAEFPEEFKHIVNYNKLLDAINFQNGNVNFNKVVEALHITSIMKYFGVSITSKDAISFIHINTFKTAIDFNNQRVDINKIIQSINVREVMRKFTASKPLTDRIDIDKLQRAITLSPFHINMNLVREAILDKGVTDATSMAKRHVDEFLITFLKNAQNRITQTIKDHQQGAITTVQSHAFEAVKSIKGRSLLIPAVLSTPLIGYCAYKGYQSATASNNNPGNEADNNNNNQANQDNNQKTWFSRITEYFSSTQR